MEEFLSSPGIGIGVLIGLILLPFVHAWVTAPERKDRNERDDT